ncbi:hypothetical protein SEVIR_9G357900v4 [Setaria viridis]|uniref:Armadillo repeat-containing domain-containing protein n=1 Tax=Setaria viridis TaxID=4556 RepID=A0A4U6T1H7_SETVI|nr:uncharacterized protein LOC117836079 [Setaria viridis]TKV95349.1 hypothetical protein SEVIR_9G357900v2 [Setaria viridis]
MECPPPVRREDGEIDWAEAARKYLDVVSSGHEGAAVRATLEIKRMASHAPDPAVRLAVWALVGLLDRSPPPRLQAAASQALCSVVRVDGGKFADEIVDAGFLPVAQRLLPESEEVPQRILLRCLSCILSFHATSRVVFARGGGAEVILDLFQGCSGATKRHLVEILSALALVREVRRLILADGKVEYLVEAISFGNLVSRTRAAQSAGLLGASTNGRSSLVEMGAPLALVGLMRDGDSSAKLVAANALGIVSSIGHHLPLIHQSGAIPLYAELLKENPPLAKDIVEDVFCILVSIRDNTGAVLENLAGILTGQDDLAISSAVDVLLALAEYKSIITFLKSSGVITVLVDLLQNRNHDVVEKVTGVVAQLSYEECIREGLMEAGAIPILLDLLHGRLEDLTEFAAAEALINFSEDPSCREYAPMLQRVPELSAFRDHLFHFRISQGHLIQSARRRIEQRLNSQ